MLEAMAGRASAKIMTWDGRELPAELRDLPPGRYSVEPVEEWGLSDEEEAGLEGALDAADRGECLDGDAVMADLRRLVASPPR